MHNISFIKLLYTIIYLVSLIILPFNIYIQTTKEGGFSIMPDRLNGEDTLRFGGALYHAHNGMVLGFISLLLVYLIFIRNHKTILNYTLLLTAYLGVFLTNCRSVWGGVFVCTFLILFTKIETKIGKIAFFIILGSLIILGMNDLMNKYQTLGQTGFDLKYRQIIWQTSINGIIESPVIGYGSESYFQKNPHAREFIADSLYDSHNSFIDLFLQTGVPGSIILILLYFKIYKQFKTYTICPELYVLFVFWIFVPFFWGHIFIGTTGFIQFFFPLTIFSIFLHPELDQAEYV